MGLFQKFIGFIYSRGISEEHPEDNKLIGLLNIISLLTTVGCLIIFLLTATFTEDYVYMTLSLVVGLIYFMIVILHHFQMVEQAKLYFSGLVPYWYVLTTLCIGGDFSQNVTAVGTIVITYRMFQKREKLRNALIVYNMFLYILPALYVHFYSPIFGLRDYPFDEIFVFVMALGWISIVFSVYEEKTETYIASLRDTNDELKEKTTELERFNYIASHDLKSPLRNITGFLNLIKRDFQRDRRDNIEEYIDYTLTSAHQMSELLKGVLEISTAGKDTKENYQVVDLNSTLEKAIRNLQQDIQEANAKVEVAGLLPFYGNESDLIVVFQNLIQNGLKYNTSEKPEITISSNQISQQQVISFRDNGIGISEEYHNQIFEFFKRLHTTHEYPGTGLGLGLCKKIVNKYNGDISVDSKVGEYSVFSISLPLAEEQNMN